MEAEVFHKVLQMMDVLCLVLEEGVVRFANGKAETTLGRKLLGQQIKEDLLQSQTPFVKCKSFNVGHYTVCLGTDVSYEYKEIQRLKGELEKRREFFATATHEIRSAANSILGYLALFVDEEIKLAHREELAQKAYSAALRLSALVNDLLDYVRIEEGAKELKDEPLKINSMLHEMIEDLKGYAFRKGVELQIPSLGEGLTILGEKRAFCRVMRNILDNAIKFTSMKEKGEKKVHDTGIGIEPEKLPHLFEPFVSYSPGGTGLGLALCKKLIGLMQGEIAIHSAGINKGTTVELWFRRAGVRK